MPQLRKVINVHGCFWHLHACRHGRAAPVANASYWAAKRQRNADRDRRTRRALARAGWRVLTIWECQTRDRDRLAQRVCKFLRE